MRETFHDALEREVERILADPMFVRAPTQSRLLKFLAEHSAGGESVKLTQYDIATEALGKRQDFDSVTDSHVRTQISRLRASLVNYYSRNEPVGDGCIYIRPGEYKLRLGSRSVAYPRSQPFIEAPHGAEDGSASTQRDEREKDSMFKLASLADRKPRALFASGFLFSIAVMAILAQKSGVEPDSTTFTGAALNRPYVGYSIDSVGFAAEKQEFEEMELIARAAIEDNLARSMTAHLLRERDERKADYGIKVHFDLDAEGMVTADFFLSDEEGRTVYQGYRVLPEDVRAASNLIKEELTVLTAPPGIIARNQAKRIEERPRSGYECFVLVEVGRAEGTSIPDLLTACQDRFPESEYTPYLAARELFWAFQKEAVQKGMFEENSPHWRKLGVLLEDNPENPYLNAVAAKVLLGNGDCELAQPFIETLLGQGNVFPALELMLATEAAVCPQGERPNTYWEKRTLEILNANRQPHALLELYQMTALLAYERPDLISKLPAQPFTQPDQKAVSQLIANIRSSVVSKDSFTRAQELEAIVWNRKVREQITQRLDG